MEVHCFHSVNSWVCRWCPSSLFISFIAILVLIWVIQTVLQVFRTSQLQEEPQPRPNTDPPGGEPLQDNDPLEGTSQGFSDRSVSPPSSDKNDLEQPTEGGVSLSSCAKTPVKMALDGQSHILLIGDSPSLRRQSSEERGDHICPPQPVREEPWFIIAHDPKITLTGMILQKQPNSQERLQASLASHQQRQPQSGGCRCSRHPPIVEETRFNTVIKKLKSQKRIRAWLQSLFGNRAPSQLHRSSLTAEDGERQELLRALYAILKD